MTTMAGFGINGGFDLPGANTLGYIPIIGSMVGITRVIVGLAVAKIALIGAIFNTLIFNNPSPFGEIFLEALSHVGRGCIETVPFVGGLTTFIYDRMMGRPIFN